MTPHGPVNSLRRLRDVATRLLGRGASATIRRYLMAVAIVLVTAAISELLYDVFHMTRVSMVFLAGVLVAAVLLGEGPALMAAILGYVIYNYYMTEPRFQLEFASAEDVFVLLAFVLVALLTGSLAGRARDESAKARARAASVQTLYEASREFSSAWDEPAIRAQLVARIAANGSACSLWTDNPSEAVMAGRAPPPDVASLVGLSVGSDQDHGPRIARRGAWTVRRLRQDAPEFGCIAWTRAPGRVGDDDPDRTVDIIVDLGAAAIARARQSANQSRLDALAKTEQLRNALLSSISHDFRTPLAAILASVSGLREMFDDLDVPTREDFLATIQEEAERLNRFVVNLLHMTRLESGVLQARDLEVDLTEVVDQVAKRFAIGRDQGRLELSGPRGGILVRGDPVLLEHAIANVVENALRFSQGDGPVTLSVVPAADEVRLHVIDCGPGVDPGNLERIFEKFFQQEPHRLQTAGTGLGLSIARGLFEAMHGAIIAENRADRPGLHVRMTLPMAA